MQTERPHDKLLPEQSATNKPVCIAAKSDEAMPGPTDDDLELIDIRYEQFVAQSRLDNLMFEH